MNINPPGVYFGMPHDTYLADDSLSNSGIKNLMVSPINYWRNSGMNSNRKPVHKKCFDEGTAYHDAAAFGKDYFIANYVPKLLHKYYPAAIDGLANIKKICKENGLKISGTIPELCERIVDEGVKVELYPVIKSEYEKTHADKVFLDSDVYTAIMKLFNKVFAIDGIFSNCKSEVSIFWIDKEYGAPMKARFDAIGDMLMPDIKTFTNSKNTPINQCLINEISNRKYHVQAAVYIDALKNSVDLPFFGGEKPEWWNNTSENVESFDFVFIEKDINPVIAIKKLLLTSSVFKNGYKRYRYGVIEWAINFRNHSDEAWDDGIEISNFEDCYFPQYMIN